MRKPGHMRWSGRRWCRSRFCPPICVKSAQPHRRRGLQLLSPTAEAVPIPVSMAVSEVETTVTPSESAYDKRNKRKNRRKRGHDLVETGQAEETTAIVEETAVPVKEIAAELPVEPAVAASAPVEPVSESRRRRRRRKSRGKYAPTEAIGGEDILGATPVDEFANAFEEAAEILEQEIPAMESLEAVAHGLFVIGEQAVTEEILLPP